jgi:hypothetical protein
VTVWVSIVAAFASNWPIGFFVGGLAVFWYVAGRLGALHRLRSAGRAGVPGVNGMRGRVAV